jgi:thiol-disulfide isomerase/thioredoxin
MYKLVTFKHGILGRLMPTIISWQHQLNTKYSFVHHHITKFGLFLILIHISFTGIGQPVNQSLAQLKEQAIDFSGRTLSGKDFKLSNYRGKVVMLNFWSTGCGACNAELADFNRLVKNFSDSSFVLISVIDETTEDLTKPVTSPYNLRIHSKKEGFYKYNRKLLGNDKIDFEIITDGKKIRDALGISYSSPQTLYLDKNGVIKDISHGYIGSLPGQDLNYKMHHDKIQWLFYGVNWDNKRSVIEISSEDYKSLDSLKVSCDLVNLFPQTEPEGEVSHDNGKVYINIRHQKPTTAYLSIEGKRYYVFLIPHDTLKIILDEKQRPVDFDGIADRSINIVKTKKISLVISSGPNIPLPITHQIWDK